MYSVYHCSKSVKSRKVVAILHGKANLETETNSYQTKQMAKIYQITGMQLVN